MRLGSGGLWQEVYGALESQGLSVVGGRVPTVGVGGLLLGGTRSACGFNLLANQTQVARAISLIDMATE